MELFLGIEFGSTRIKAVLVDFFFKVKATGVFDWENRLENGVWIYHMEDVWKGLRESFFNLASDYKQKYGHDIDNISGIGISGMMHGYLVFDKYDKQLAPFQTWRNTSSLEASEKLSDAFDLNIPQRWSVSNVYQNILNNAAHTKEIAYLPTLSSYIHYMLTGQKVVGLSEASGMFPVDSRTGDFHADKLKQFDKMVELNKLPWKLKDIFPKPLAAGQIAGTLTEKGVRIIDPGGQLCGALKAGIPLCPPEGDAGTGLVATNSLLPGTGSVSVGTSVFTMLVLEKELLKRYSEFAVITTPTGRPVALVQCNNGTSDLDTWVRLFGDFIMKMGLSIGRAELYQRLYESALNAETDGGGLISFNYLAGEHITGFEAGRPLFARSANSNLSLENFMRTLIFSMLATLRIGMDILTGNEGVKITNLLGHGGFFKTPIVGQKLLSSALNVPISVMESSGEGGAWGIALLAAYMQLKQKGESLEDFVAKAFADVKLTEISPETSDVVGFEQYLERYKHALPVLKAAVRENSVHFRQIIHINL